MVGALQALPVVAALPFAVAASTRPFFFKPLLLRGLHIGHVLPVLLQHATPVHLTTETLERAINVFVVSDFYTNSQGRSLRREFGFEIEQIAVKVRRGNAKGRAMFLFLVPVSPVRSFALMTTLSPLVLATGNAGKVDELRALLGDLALTLIPASELDDPPTVTEDADTLDGNARKKARAFHEHTGYAALADDTGLEVTALDGGPGVHTARFAGPDATPEDNKQKLLTVMEGVDNRRARFRTVVALIDAEGTARTFEGRCQGTITTAPRGDGGFGYDPLFLPDGHNQTFAEMPAKAKNRISHRRKALDALRTFLKTLEPHTDR